MYWSTCSPLRQWAQQKAETHTALPMTACDFETTLLTKGQKTSGCAPGKFMLQNSIGYMQLLSEGKKYQPRWISIYQASTMETNSHLCISNSLTHRQMSPPGTLYLSADRFLEKKNLHTGRSKLHLSCFLKGTEYAASFQAGSSRLKSPFSC